MPEQIRKEDVQAKSSTGGKLKELLLSMHAIPVPVKSRWIISSVQFILQYVSQHLVESPVPFSLQFPTSAPQCHGPISPSSSPSPSPHIYTPIPFSSSITIPNPFPISSLKTCGFPSLLPAFPQQFLPPHPAFSEADVAPVPTFGFPGSTCGQHTMAVHQILPLPPHLVPCTAPGTAPHQS